MTPALHAQTPILAVFDPRGLTVGKFVCCRSDEHQPAQLRYTRHAYDPAARVTSSQDPRLPTPNQRTVYSLSGQVLSTDSVDAGWRVTLLGEADQVLEGWNGRGTQQKVEYDELLRPVLIGETPSRIDSGGTGFSREDASAVAADFSPDRLPSRLKPVPHATPDQDPQAQIFERFTYGGPDSAEHNQCNQLIRHDDTAGTIHLPDYGLLGSPLSEVRHFLQELDMPDWPLTIAERDALLEANGLESSWAFNALGEVIRQTDAMGNTQRFKQTVTGQLKSVALGEQVLLNDLHYNAFDQVEQQTAGNGVISRSTYDPQTGRLSELSSGLEAAPPLQHFKYSYDPVGNIEQIEDATQPVRFFANQRVEPISHYRYDTLYQLIEATGREVRTDASHGPALPDLQNLPPDPNQIANYTQTYEYDAGGNLLEMHHVGAQPFNRTMHVAPDSNRSLPADEVDVDFENGFDANGNLLQLVRGQSLSWDARNQLRHVTTVQRNDGPSDNEIYIYDGGGQRCRKISSAQASGRTLINEVRYLPGLEIRSNADGEVLHVITVNNVRLLHWPAGTHSDQLRYSLSDHLGSSTLELDQQGALISQESYYPFGGTSWWAARSAVEAKYKIVRYSGKERDASGLYYYGYRYYAPWLQRWINPDPAGDVDGLNLFRFVSNCPISMFDTRGLYGKRDKLLTIESAKHHYTNYLSPKILTRKETDKQRAIDSLVKRTGSSRANSVADLLEAAHSTLEVSPMTFNINPKKLPKLTGNSMINAWKSLQKINPYVEIRDTVENQMFEYQNSDSKITRKAATLGRHSSKAYSRPLYGSLQISEDPETVGGAPTYGKAAFFLQNSARKYMTFTAADSLSIHATHENLAMPGNLYPLIADMRPDTWEVLNNQLSGAGKPVRVTESSSYIEWQSHAPIEWRDMEFLAFQRKTDFEEAISTSEIINFYKQNSLSARIKRIDH